MTTLRIAKNYTTALMLTNEELDTRIAETTPGTEIHEEAMKVRAARIKAAHALLTLRGVAEDLAWAWFESGKYGYLFGLGDVQAGAQALGRRLTDRECDALETFVREEINALRD